ncbi:hypothetical protein CNMCM8980_004023 [Aspergillus fumigatiaffinis]|uniref:Aminoglycoside phosphotransferase domain-containing protein n=1 Tax=Aspergillus fumigatiaffinis TaxID=340414 RepID=A0A8H4GRP0_9EURO|nr:hypothetical protein CNMCM5878_004228 [Aspergillus fumigatiaffinis]KAF4226977.1 hypothetical protein CNMCM6805_003762 [Aspergillus fumigatiaffinis]KAF4234195.1 hypothetical protein CNMCM8980_004023 [Aspergillus fumigatiaffinis]
MSRPILTEKCMDFDDVAWKQSDQRFDIWKKEKLLKRENLIAVGNLIDKWRGGVPDTLLTPGRGAFNVWVRLKFTDGGSAVMRIPCYGRSMFPEEKVQREVSVMRFLERHTSIQVPHILHYRMTKESPDVLGPFIIMEYIEHEYDLVDALNTPAIPDDERPILDPQISEERLIFAYGQMADIVLQLSKHTFTEVGCIARANEDDDFDGVWVVKHRPLTLNMNELVQVGNFPPHLLPDGPFPISSSYYQALADMHINHLVTQRNDAVDSPEDCRTKCIARFLFRKLAREGRFCKYNDRGPFKLFCDDFRPANVLTNAEFKVVGAIDWEYIYAAPLEFAYSAPFWLLLELPEYWPKGLDDWTNVYETRLETFLRVLEEREKVAIDRGPLSEEHRLSTYMRDSWETGDFWVHYAARRSWAFDMIYWAKIDRRFFGDGNLDDRLELLTADERQEIDDIVQKKMKEKEERKLTDWTLNSQPC